MHKVPNTNVFIIVKNKQKTTYDSCSCGIIKVRLLFFAWTWPGTYLNPFTAYFIELYFIYFIYLWLFQDESGTPQCSPEDDCECPCHAPAQYDYCENQLPPKMCVCYIILISVQLHGCHLFLFLLCGKNPALIFLSSTCSNLIFSILFSDGADKTPI